MPYINTFEDTSEHYAALIEKGHEFALQFNALMPFNAFRYVCPVMSSHGGTLELTLYAFCGTYQATLESHSAAQGHFDLADGTDMVLGFDTLPAGEYLLVAHDGTLGAGFCGLIDSFGGAQLYMNGTPCDGSMEAAVCFTEEADDYFGELTYDEAAARTPAPRHETRLPSTHPINALNVPGWQWSAVDGLGRKLPDYAEAGAARKNKAVGLFFWDWHYHYENSSPVNVHELTTAHPELKNDYNNPLWNEHKAEAYHWNEPVWGYYTSSDKYVLRKQAQMLADADVDFIIFDCTNGTYTWKLGYEILLETFAEARMQGIKTPQIVFMLNFAPFRSSWVMLRQIYTDIYRRGRYSDLWYYHNGKPLIIAHNDCHQTGRKLDREILDFFTFRRNDPVYFTREPAPEGTWGWLSLNPQARYCVRSDGGCEQVTVGVAHNASENGLVPMNDIRGGVFGRSHTTDPAYSYSYNKYGSNVTISAATQNAHYYGLNFQEQWDYAIKCDPDIVFVTGWNEWVAGRHEMWQNSPNAFPDEYNDEFSRDIEPSSGELCDHYYMQLAANIRRFKGLRSDAPASTKRTVNIDDISSWNDIPEANCYLGSAPLRDNRGWAGCHYTNNTARNEIVGMSDAWDDERLYFKVRCAQAVTEPGEAWMRLFISSDDSCPGWESFDYIINRTAPAGGRATVERSLGGWCWEKIGEAEYSLKGDTLTISVPRSLVGQGGRVALRYKWADNTRDGEILSFYTDGSVAPGGRFTVTMKG